MQWDYKELRYGYVLRSSATDEYTRFRGDRHVRKSLLGLVGIVAKNSSAGEAQW
jgi:hypothetical protein